MSNRGASDSRQRDGLPYVEIIEEPQTHGQRFRYRCEGRSAGSIIGVRSTTEKKTFPAIQIKNYPGQGAIVVVSCVSKDSLYKPHPHNLVGTDCKDGVCTVKVKANQSLVTFPNIGIQCCKKQEVKASLEVRQNIRVDPFATGIPTNPSMIDLSVVRLCFQVFLPDVTKKFTNVVPPVVSEPIIDKKSVHDLVICRISRTAGSVLGKDEVFLLCEKVNKDDIQVRFFEEKEDGVVWEDFGDFTASDVHRQVAIVFRTPPYYRQDIVEPVTVQMQLQSINKSEFSEPKQFQYHAVDPDPDGVKSKKRKLTEQHLFNFLNDSTLPSSFNDVKEEPGMMVMGEGHRKMARKGQRVSAAAGSALKIDAFSPPRSSTLPQYSFTNTGAIYSLPPGVDQNFLSLLRSTAPTAPVAPVIEERIDEALFSNLSGTIDDLGAFHSGREMTSDEVLQFIGDNMTFSSGEILEGQLYSESQIYSETDPATSDTP